MTPGILFRDDHLVAVTKPAGMLVHRSDLDRHETRFLLQDVRDLVGERVYPAHRLDRPTSGVVLFARSAPVAEQLGRMFAAGGAEKRYLAVVRGYAPDEGLIDCSLAPLPGFPGEDAAGAAKPSRTHYRRLATAELAVAVGRYPTARYSLLEVVPLTGRRHQIRRHLKHIRHPIIGDTTYGEGRHNRLFRDEFGCSRLLLHAGELALSHPVTGDPLRIFAPLDGEFTCLVERLGWTDAVPAGMRPVPA